MCEKPQPSETIPITHELMRSVYEFHTERMRELQSELMKGGLWRNMELQSALMDSFITVHEFMVRKSDVLRKGLES